MKKGILIDIEKQEIREVEVGGLESKQGYVGGLIQIAFETEDEKNVIFVDEEGLLKNNDKGFFLVEGGHQPFKGSGIVCGFDPETGDDADISLTVEEVTEMVTFKSQTEIALMYA